MQGEILSGFAEGINERGELIVRLQSGEVKTVNAGEVTTMKN